MLLPPDAAPPQAPAQHNRPSVSTNQDPASAKASVQGKVNHAQVALFQRDPLKWEAEQQAASHTIKPTKLDFLGVQRMRENYQEKSKEYKFEISKIKTDAIKSKVLLAAGVLALLVGVIVVCACPAAAVIALGATGIVVGFGTIGKAAALCPGELDKDKQRILQNNEETIEKSLEYFEKHNRNREAPDFEAFLKKYTSEGQNYTTEDLRKYLDLFEKKIKLDEKETLIEKTKKEISELEKTLKDAPQMFSEEELSTVDKQKETLNELKDAKKNLEKDLNEQRTKLQDKAKIKQDLETTNSTLSQLLDEKFKPYLETTNSTFSQLLDEKSLSQLLDEKFKPYQEKTLDELKASVKADQELLEAYENGSADLRGLLLESNLDTLDEPAKAVLAEINKQIEVNDKRIEEKMVPIELIKILEALNCQNLTEALTTLAQQRNTLNDQFKYPETWIRLYQDAIDNTDKKMAILNIMIGDKLKTKQSSLDKLNTEHARLQGDFKNDEDYAIALQKNKAPYNGPDVRSSDGRFIEWTNSKIELPSRNAIIPIQLEKKDKKTKSPIYEQLDQPPQPIYKFGQASGKIPRNGKSDPHAIAEESLASMIKQTIKPDSNLQGDLKLEGAVVRFTQEQTESLGHVEENNYLSNSYLKDIDIADPHTGVVEKYKSVNHYLLAKKVEKLSRSEEGKKKAIELGLNFVEIKAKIMEAKDAKTAFDTFKFFVTWLDPKIALFDGPPGDDAKEEILRESMDAELKTALFYKFVGPNGNLTAEGLHLVNDTKGVHLYAGCETEDATPKLKDPPVIASSYGVEFIDNTRMIGQNKLGTYLMALRDYLDEHRLPQPK